MQKPEGSTLHSLDTISNTIEPGKPEQGSYSERQQLVLDLDELIERNYDLLSLVTVDCLATRDGLFNWKDEISLRIDADVDENQVDDTLKKVNQCISGVMRLLDRYHTAGNERMIAHLVFAFENRKWVPGTVLEVCRSLGNQLGPIKDTDAWLGHHRSDRQAKRLADATLDAISPTTRRRVL